MTETISNSISGLPGEELIRKGLSDLERGEETVESLLVAIARPRLNKQGVGNDLVDKLADEPELRLYRMLRPVHGNNAHLQYNSLIRRLISFENALECRNSREGKKEV